MQQWIGFLQVWTNLASIQKHWKKQEREVDTAMEEIAHFSWYDEIENEKSWYMQFEI